MKRALRDKWVAALRSNNYEQGYGRLRGERFRTGTDEYVATFCCLGVLCDVIDPERWQNDCWQTPEGVYDPDDDTNTWWLESELDDALLHEIGMTVHDQKELVHMNDDQQAPFAVIADMIEREIEIED